MENRNNEKQKIKNNQQDESHLSGTEFSYMLNEKCVI